MSSQGFFFADANENVIDEKASLSLPNSFDDEYATLTA